MLHPVILWASGVRTVDLYLRDTKKNTVHTGANKSLKKRGLSLTSRGLSDMACLLLKKCHEASGMNCEERDFNQCLLYASLHLERNHITKGIQKRLNSITTERYLK